MFPLPCSDFVLVGEYYHLINSFLLGLHKHIHQGLTFKFPVSVIASKEGISCQKVSRNDN